MLFLSFFLSLLRDYQYGGLEGQELAKEVDFIFMFSLLLRASPFCDVHWLVGFPFCEAVILYSLLFQKLHQFFFFFCFT